MIDVRLDKTRIHSIAAFNARVWDRHSGDCLYVMDQGPFLSSLNYRVHTGLLDSFLEENTFISAGGTWRIFRRDSYHPGWNRFHGKGGCLGPIRGDVRKLRVLSTELL